jgi:hypothetical protein
LTVLAGGGAAFVVCATAATERPKPTTKAAATCNSRFRVATIEVSLQEKYSGDLSSGWPDLSTAGRARRPRVVGMRLAIEPTVSYNRKHGGGLKAWASYPIIPS